MGEDNLEIKNELAALSSILTEKIFSFQTLQNGQTVVKMVVDIHLNKSINISYSHRSQGNE